MDITTMRERVEHARVARLATVGLDSRPHVVPCCFVLVKEVLYSAVDAKPKSTLALRRLDNVRAAPWVAMLVDHYDDDWAALWWIRIDGMARVIDSGPEFDQALLLLADKYEQYVRNPPPGPVIAIDVTGWRAWP
jgi:PPOX class probable F420-dependent enzyme